MLHLERPLGGEAVVVAANLPDLQALSGYRLQVIVARDRPGDTRGPQVDVAPGAFLERPAADHVGDRQAAPGRSTRAASEKTRSLRGDRLITPFEMTASKLASAKGSLDVGLHELDLGEPGLVAQTAGLGELFVGDVDAGDAARPSTSTAAQNRSVPDPEPRSSTASPGWRAARSRW